MQDQAVLVKEKVKIKALLTLHPLDASKIAYQGEYQLSVQCPDCMVFAYQHRSQS